MALPSPTTPLDACLNLHDFERVAEATLKPKVRPASQCSSAKLTLRFTLQSWAYYASAADDLRTKTLNTSIYSQIRFRPRVLVDVQDVDTSVSILGYKSRYPFFIAPAAMGSELLPSVAGSAELIPDFGAELAHQDGEVCLVKGAGATDIHYGVSDLPSSMARSR